MDIRTAAALLNGKVTGAGSILFPTPGHSSSDRGSSLRIDPSAPDGLLIHVFNGADPIAVKRYVLATLGIAEGNYEAVDPIPVAKRSNQDIARKVWRESVRPDGSLVEAYLGSRYLSLTEETLALDVIRFHPHCRFGDEHHPAMISLMRDINTNAGLAIHRTALRKDGTGKASMSDGGSPKRMLGPATGAAIKLTYVNEDGDMAIAEGIENGLTVANCIGKTTWVVGSTSGMSAFPVIKYVPSLSMVPQSGQRIFLTPSPTLSGPTSTRSLP